MSWLATPDKTCMGAHVLPIDDDREHEAHRQCWCHPYLDPDSDSLVWIHVCMDGRERHEGPYGAPLH